MARLTSRIFKDQLVGLLKTNDLFGESRHAFLNYISCASYHVVFYLASLNVDKKNAIIMIFPDKTEPFDRMPHV